MRLIDADGSYTIKASDNTDHSLCFGGGIISVMDDRGHCVCEFDAEDAPTVEAVVLPCKLGTTLYRICEEGRGRKPFIREVTFNRTNFARIVLDNEVGRTVFLTREEAEAALAKMKGLEVGT